MRTVRRWLAIGGLLAAAALVTAPAVQADGNEAPGAPVAARSLTTGWDHTCVRLTTGDVKCFGEAGFEGTLGYDDEVTRGDGPGEMGTALPAVQLGGPVTAVSAGWDHSCALLATGHVRCWGRNDVGQLGIGAGSDRGDDPGEMAALPPVDLGVGRTAVAVATGDLHSCAILDNGTVKCWGTSSSGQLGQGVIANIGDNSNEMGDNLQPVDLGTGRTATALALGGNHTCALLDTGAVKCWGANNVGQLGQGDTTVRGDGPNELGDDLQPVDLGLGRTATAIAAFDRSTCALLDDGRIRCWGNASSGQLGNGTGLTRGDEPGEMGDDLPTVLLGTGRTAKAISLGQGHACAILDTNRVKCWGRNTDGQLGLGNNTSRTTQDDLGDDLPTIDLGTGRTARAVSAGREHTCALLDNGRVKCWGEGALGQIGSGNGDFVGDDAGEMGNALAPVPLGQKLCDGFVVTVDLSLSQAPTAGADVILGTAANNTINAGGGNDRVCSGGGRDTINGGLGADRVFGSTGNDVLRGADGNDNLNGEAGTDTLDGGTGNDRLNGGTQADTCHGRAGTDSQSGCETRTGIP